MVGKKLLLCSEKKKKKIRACYRRVNPLPGTCCSPYELPVTLLYFLGIISISLISCAVRYVFSPSRGGKEGVGVWLSGLQCLTPNIIFCWNEEHSSARCNGFGTVLCLGVCTYRGGAEWEISGQRVTAFPGRGVDRNREFSYSELDSSEINFILCFWNWLEQTNFVSWIDQSQYLVRERTIIVFPPYFWSNIIHSTWQVRARSITVGKVEIKTFSECTSCELRSESGCFTT